MRWLLILVSCCFVGGCCSWYVTSENTIYRGQLIGFSDSTVEIYATNMRRGVGVFANGEIRPVVKPQRPDTTGFFLVGGTTPSHDECSTPNHWKGGPFEIYIRGPHIEDYHDTLSVEDLKALPKLKADSLGIKLRSNEIGIWQLPNITLVPK